MHTVQPKAVPLDEDDGPVKYVITKGLESLSEDSKSPTTRLQTRRMQPVVLGSLAGSTNRTKTNVPQKGTHLSREKPYLFQVFRVLPYQLRLTIEGEVDLDGEPYNLNFLDDLDVEEPDLELSAEVDVTLDIDVGKFETLGDESNVVFFPRMCHLFTPTSLVNI